MENVILRETLEHYISINITTPFESPNTARPYYYDGVNEIPPVTSATPVSPTTLAYSTGLCPVDQTHVV